MLKRSLGALVTITLILLVAVGSAQQGDPRRGAGPDTLPDTPQVLGTAEQRFRVVPIKGLVRPSALAFLPNGDILVAERLGRLRIVHDGVLDPRPIGGMPEVTRGPNNRLGLWDVALHPRFADNRLIYFTYLKLNLNENIPPESRASGMAVLARGRFDGGHLLTDVKDLFVSNALTDGFIASKIAFAPDGKIFMSIGMPIRDKAHGGANRVGSAEQAQDPDSHAGKVLRLNDDGTVPSDNPFVGKPGYRPEIYALGFRNALGLMIHPQTGELWEAEHGPQGGDEVNIIRAGRNYGWPVISFGRAYDGDVTQGQGASGPEREQPCAPGMEQPFLFWVPVIGPGGMTVYTGDKFPAWRGNLFVGGMVGTQLHRVVFNQRGLPTRREALLTELKQRIRDVKQGPDGLLYLTTDHEAGALLKIEPVVETSTSSAQQAAPRKGFGPDTLPDTPQVLGTAGQRFRVVPIKGLVRPSALAFLPNGDILVAERAGRLRIVHDGVVDPQPISGMPTVNMGSTNRHGLWDMALHPRFADNRLIYFTYLNWNANENVPPDSRRSGTSVLARARFDGGHLLTDVRDLFVSNAWTDGPTAAKIAFAPDGKIFMSIGMPIRDRAHGGPNRVGTAEQAQDPSSHAGKVLRLNDDGTVPSDNPFVGKPGYQPEIYALGFRNALGLMIHPQTGELWESEHGPQGGDEVNIIKAGRNYGWPVISLGRSYGGDLTGNSGPEREEPCAPGMEQPFLFWVPIIGPSGMTVYTGDKFPAWKGNLFIGGQESTQLHRVVFSQRGLPTRREALLTELKQRIRDVKQGPDGLLYLATDHEAGALLKIEPIVETSRQ